jgi:hypothetical protein
MFCASFSRSPVAPEKEKQKKNQWKKLKKSCASFSSRPWRLKGGKKWRY